MLAFNLFRANSKKLKKTMMASHQSPLPLSSPCECPLPYDSYAIPSSRFAAP